MDRTIKLIVRDCSYSNAGKVMDQLVNKLDDLPDEKTELMVSVKADIYKAEIEKQTRAVKIIVSPFMTFDEVFSAVEANLQH